MLLNVLLILIVLSSKMIIANVSKFSLYEIKEDIIICSSKTKLNMNIIKNMALENMDFMVHHINMLHIELQN